MKRAYAGLGFSLGLALATVAACKGGGGSGAPAADAGGSGGGGDASPVLEAGVVSFDWSALDAEEFGGAWQTDGVVVLVDGRVAYERYAPSWSETTPHILYSATKSIESAIVGIAIADGRMKKEDSVCAYVAAPDAGSSLCDTTIEDLLHMSSGLAWVEDYTGADPTQSNVLEMLYGAQSDMGAYVASLPRAAPANTAFNYSSGDANLLGLALKNALAGQDVRAYLQARLFGPAGITSALCEEDRSGTVVFSTDCFMTVRDFATFGQLYLDDGMRGGTRVLPAGWVEYTRTPAPAVSTPASRLLDAGAAPGGSYGAEWWLNAVNATATSDTWEYPDEPVDGFQAEGHYGQKLVVVPSRKLVVARVGSDVAKTYDPDAMIRAAVAAVDGASHGASARPRMDAPPPPRPAIDPIANEVQLAAGYAAKEACSCVFVEGQSDDACTQYGVGPTGSSVTLTIDHTASTVTAKFAASTRVATFTAGQGCVLGGL